MNAETILVVDDSQPLADFLAYTLLPSMGFKVQVAYNGASALQIIKTNPPALMLLDLEMPDMTGLELLRRLANQNLSVPTILFTAHGSEQIAMDAFRLGVQNYLIKPVEEENLSAAITQALTETRLRQEAARLTHELQEQISWLNALAKTGQNVTSTLDLGDVLRRIVEAGVQLTQAEEGFLALLDSPSGQLYLRAVKSMDEKAIKTLRLPVLDSLVGEVLRTGKPHRASRPANGQPLKVTTGFLVQSLLHVPIILKGRPLGVLSVDNRTGRRAFTEKDEEILISLASYAAVAIENAGLYQRAQNEIAERKRVEEALRESEDRYARAVQGANDGIWDWDLRNNQVYFSPRWKAMLGYSETDIAKDPVEWLNRIHPEDLDKVKQSLSAHIRASTPHFESEHRIRQKDGSYCWVLSRGLAVRGTDGLISRIAGSQTDISARKTAEARLRYDAFYDRLTGLPNRAYLMDRLKYVISLSKQRKGYMFAVLFLDLDQFKNVNDRFGHPLGDQLLVEVGKFLRSGLRGTDTVARLGGDEFIILLEDIAQPDVAALMSERIFKLFSTPINLANNDIFVTTSIGVVLSTLNYEQPEDILRDADIAMYAAKAHGKATYRIYNPAMHSQIVKRLGMEADLRQAVQNGQLCLHYQPIISFKTGLLVGFEALARWRQPQGDIIPPGVFIPLAQETGLILLIDRWVLEHACQQIQQWQVRFPLSPPLKLNVNITSSSMAQKDMVEVIRQTLQRTGLDAHNLRLEITENIAMGSDEIVANTIAQLNELGVEIHIDDFGTGYSSLAYLQRIPVSALKIDRSFVSQIMDGKAHSEIVRTIVGLSHDLGLQAVAEGVETKEQLEKLIAIGCDLGQGFLLSKPLDHEKAETLLNQILKGEHPITPWADLIKP